MNKILIGVVAITLCGCVDLGRVGMHPELKTSYFDGSTYAVESCLYSAATSQHFSLVKDEPLSQEGERYNLQDANYENVAWITVSPFGKNQSSVDFYYAHNAPDVHKSILSMIDTCKNEL